MHRNFYLRMLRSAEVGTGSAEAATSATSGQGAALATPPTSPQQTPSQPSAGGEAAPSNGAGDGTGEARPDPAASGKTAGNPEVETTPLVFTDVTMPEGFTATEETLKPLLDILNESGGSPKDTAQKLVELYAQNVSASQEQQTQEWNTLMADWRKQVDALPEFAGNVEAGLGNLKQALHAAGASEDFFKALDVTGAGSNPHILQLFHKLTRPYAEGGAVGGSHQTTAPQMAQTMFPTMNGAKG